LSSENASSKDFPKKALPGTSSSGLDDAPPPADLLRRGFDDPQGLLAEVFDVFHDRYWHLLNFRMDHRLMSRVDADDILQDAYLAAQQRIHHWIEKPKFSLFAWVRMIVVQSLIDVHRQHIGADMRCAGREVTLGGPRMPHTTAASLANGLAGNQTSPSGAAMRNESQEQLMAAISQMSEIDQEMIALRHFEGLSNKQAAEVLELSMTAASNRYVRAIAKLQEVLGD
jgi:RNA polymerase sigma-70 factor (ECF subfamily)